MDEESPGLVSEAIQQVLELSADAHIARRLTVKESPAFHRLTAVINEYGKALELLVAVQKREEFYVRIERLSPAPSAFRHPLLR